MGLLDKKSESKNIIVYRRTIFGRELVYYDYDNAEVVEDPDTKEEQTIVKKYPVSDLYMDILNELVDEDDYVDKIPFSVLIDADLNKLDDYTESNKVRRFLESFNLLNENDRQEMLKLGIKEEHAFLRLRDTEISVRSYNSLYRYTNIYYAWELLRYSCEDLLKIKTLGKKSIIDIANVFKNLGYTLKGFSDEEYHIPTEEEIAEAAKNREITKIENNIHKIIDSKKAYLKQIAELQEKVDLMDIELESETKKLARIRKENN